MRQVISISPEGNISGLQMKPGKGFDLRSLGRAEIVRASEVVWREGPQMWAVEFKGGAAGYDGAILTLGVWMEAGSPPIAAEGRTSMEPDGTLVFAEYEDAVRAEIATLDGLRLLGKL